MNRIFIIISFIFSATIYSSEVNDPFENINRKTFEFNENLDEKILKPTAKFYSKFPPRIKNGITNFFNNLEEVDTCVNQLLQGKPKKSANDLTRFLINSTVGLGGFIDVASTMGLERHEEDFGQTLAVWGVGEGPYIMLPGLGPSTLRDTFSKPVSSFLSVTFHMTETDVNIALKSIDAIETRERLLDVESLLSGDKYAFVKDAYIQSIKYEVKDGIDVQDDFVDDMDDFLID
jgi:phospholipid-binding lipoprotein MlaA|tara:strand:- start:2133 stop:2831 length:699 start_codon:yes stop_codon:yes gene_type:complete